MRTILPQSLNTVEEIEAFIQALYDNDEFFHLDDPAGDIIYYSTGEPVFTPEEAKKIDSLLEEAFSICNVWELPLVCELVDKICSETFGDQDGE